MFLREAFLHIAKEATGRKQWKKNPREAKTEAEERGKEQKINKVMKKRIE